MATTPGGQAAHDLTRLVEDFVGEEFDENPRIASALGAQGYDDQLGDFSAEAFERRERRAAKWHAAFAAVPEAGLDLDDLIDRDLALSELRGRMVLADWAEWRRDPLTYLAPCLMGVQVPLMHRLRPEPELVAGVAARLGQIPSVLAAARANLDPGLVAPLLVQRALDQVRAAARFVREVVPAQIEDPDLRTRLGMAGEPAAQAFGEFEAWLEELAEKASGEWMLGDARYTALLRERELLDLDTAALHQRGRDAYAALDEQMREVAARVPGGGTDWRAVMEDLHADHPPTLENMREEYEAATRRAREFLREHDLVSFAPGEECRVVPAPVFQRGVLAVASYFAPPGLTDRRTGHFFVPFTPDGATTGQVEQRLRANSRASIPTIAAHETYPGHHWHLSWMAGHPHALRKVLRTPYFCEGWALYAEHVMREHGFFADPRHELAHLDARIFRAARIIVDTALHTGEMGFDEAVDFMVAHTSMPQETVRAEVRRYCWWPTQAAAYLTGAMQIERIRQRWREDNPTAPLREFHDRIAGSGGLPLGLAERVALA